MKTIQLTKGYKTLVDDADYVSLSAFKWQALVCPGAYYTRVYAVRRPLHTVKGKRGSAVLMHAEILGIRMADHRDCDGLNNQRSNLRPSNDSTNQANRRKVPGTSSRFKGVSFCKKLSKWSARVKKDGISYHLGYFAKEEDAATVYNFRAFDMFGEFARLNAPAPILSPVSGIFQSMMCVPR